MKTKRIVFSILAFVVVTLVIIAYARFYFVFAEGTKAGQLNTFQKKGYVFKTWEGILIQSGFKANIQSNEFEFSVTNEAIAKQLMENAGKEMELHYKRYFGNIPWRGNTPYVVDSVYYITGANAPTTIKPKN